MSEITTDKAEINNMDLITSKKTKYDLIKNKIDFPLATAENNLKVVTINGNDY